MTMFAMSETNQIIVTAISAFFTFMTAVATGVIGVYMARLSHEMNSMKDALVKASNIAGHAEGVEAERNRPQTPAAAQGVTIEKVDVQTMQVGEPPNGGKDRPTPPKRQDPQ